MAQRKVKPGTPHPTKKGLVMGKNGSYVSKTTYAKQVRAAQTPNTGKPQTPLRGTSGKPTQMGSNNWPKGTERFTEKPSNKGGALVKQGSSASTKPSTKGGGLATTGGSQKALPGSNPKALPPGKKGGALGRAVRGVKGVGPNAAVGRLVGKIATPLAAAGEVKEMSDRAKRDRERNIKTGNTPFRGSGNYRRAAEAREGTTKRDRQGRLIKKVQGLPADYKATEAKAFAAAPKPKTTPKAEPAKQQTPSRKSAPVQQKPKAQSPTLSAAEKKKRADAAAKKKADAAFMKAELLKIRKAELAAERQKAYKKSLEQAKKNRERGNTTARGPRD